MAEYRIKMVSLRQEKGGLVVRSSVTTDDIMTLTCLDAVAPPDAIGVTGLTASNGFDSLMVARRDDYFSVYFKNRCLMSGKGTVTRPAMDTFFIHNYNGMDGAMIVDLGGDKPQIIADIKAEASPQVDKATCHTSTPNFLWTTFMRKDDIVVLLTTVNTDQYREFSFPRKGASKVLTVIPHGGDKDMIFIVTDARHTDSAPIFCLRAHVAMTVTVHQDKKVEARFSLDPNDCDLKPFDDQSNQFVEINRIIAAKSNATAAVFLMMHGDEQDEKASFMFVDKMDGISRLVPYAKITNNSDVPPSECEIRDVRVTAFCHPDGTLITYRANVILRMPTGQVNTWLGNFTRTDRNTEMYKHHVFVEEEAIDACFCNIDVSQCDMTPHMVSLGFADLMLRRAMIVAVEGAQRLATITERCTTIDQQLETAKRELNEAAFTTATFANSAARSETARQLEADARAKSMQALLLVEQEAEQKVAKATAALSKRLVKAQKQAAVRDAEHKASQKTLETKHKEAMDDLAIKHTAAMNGLAIKNTAAMNGLAIKNTAAMNGLESRANDELTSRRNAMDLLAAKNKTLADTLAAKNKTLVDTLAARNKTLAESMETLEKELSGTIDDLMAELDAKRTSMEEMTVQMEESARQAMVSGDVEERVEIEKSARQELTVDIEKRVRQELTVEIDKSVRQALADEMNRHKQQAANEFQARMTAEQAAEQERARMLQERAVMTRDAYHAGWQSAMQPMFYQQPYQQPIQQEMF